MKMFEVDCRGGGRASTGYKEWKQNWIIYNGSHYQGLVCCPAGLSRDKNNTVSCSKTILPFEPKTK